MKTKLIILCLLFSILGQAQSYLNTLDSFEIDLWHNKTDTALYLNKSLGKINITTNKIPGQGTVALATNKIRIDETSLQSDTSFNAYDFLGSVQLTCTGFDPNNKPTLKTIYFVPGDYKPKESEDINPINEVEIVPPESEVKASEKLTLLDKKHKYLTNLFYIALCLLILSLAALAFILYQKYSEKMFWINKNKSKEVAQEDHDPKEEMSEEEKILFDQIKNTYLAKNNESHFAFDNVEDILEFLSAVELSKKIDQGSTEKLYKILAKYGIPKSKLLYSEKTPIDNKFKALESFKSGADLLKVLNNINKEAHLEVKNLIDTKNEYNSIKKAFVEDRDNSISVKEDIKVLKSLHDINSLKDMSEFISVNVNKEISDEYFAQQIKAEKLDKQLASLSKNMSLTKDEFEQFKVIDKFNKEIIFGQKEILNKRQSLLSELKKTQIYINQYFPVEVPISYEEQITGAFNYLWKRHEDFKSYEEELEFLEGSRKYFNSLKNDLEHKIQEDQSEVARSTIAKYILELAFHFKDFLNRDQSKDSEGTLNKKLMINSPGNVQGFSSNDYKIFSHNQNKFSKFLMNVNVLISDMNPIDLKGVFIDGVYFEK